LEDLAKTENKLGPPWRAQYFLESWLGFWTSDACYRHHKDKKFCAQNEQPRKKMLCQISEANPAHHKQWMDDFMDSIREVLVGLKKAGQNPSDYLHMKKQDIDEDHYCKDAQRRLSSHRDRAKNPVFEERFTKGYVFPPLPRFRGTEAVDGGSFKDFVHGLCESILNGLAKQRCKNKIVLAMREQLHRQRVRTDGMSGEELHDVIQGFWPDLGPGIKDFYI
jgi:hypothetical protein